MAKNKATNFEKAAGTLGSFNTAKQEVSYHVRCGNFIRFSKSEDGMLCAYRPGDAPGQELEGPDLRSASVGAILQFIHETIALFCLGFVDMAFGEPDITPDKLAGSASGKGRNFEEAVTEAGNRLEKQGKATLGRYPVASIMMKGSKYPMQVPSLPDFEGVTADGKQFIMEAKVCTGPSFRVYKVFIKHKQVRHMLTRSKFGVSCFLLLHFNARLGKTFHDPAFTVAIPVKSAADGGWPIWEQYASVKKKDIKKEFDSITREMAKEMGHPVRWGIPPRCKNSYPDLEPIILPSSHA